MRAWLRGLLLADEIHNVVTDHPHGFVREPGIWSDTAPAPLLPHRLDERLPLVPPLPPPLGWLRTGSNFDAVFRRDDWHPAYYTQPHSNTAVIAYAAKEAAERALAPLA